MKPDYFKDNAQDWDKGNMRVNNARKIALNIRERINLEGKEHIMDFGAGTGLLSEGIAPFIHKITAIDYSGPMLYEFNKKQWPCESETINIDLTRAKLEYTFDGIISSMTLHHIEDISDLFQKFHSLLKPGGFIALADLSKESGDFHSSNESVEHFGFDESDIRERLIKAGFFEIHFSLANTIVKEVEGNQKSFPIFLVTAFR
jgi:2-polyprenyl-3-methyl-5-hydroxy-6-metoxy-1,4-benzoquinol methylase